MEGTGQPFSLLGGPLHQPGCRLGLVRGRTNTVLLGLVLGILPWLVLWLLALINGIGDAWFSIRAIGGVATFNSAPERVDNGAGLGASHQTGWTGVIARIMHLSANPESAREAGKKTTARKASK